jgi:biopolymer transport protein TolQ
MAINFEDQFWSGQDLRSIFVELEESESDVMGVEHLFQAGFREFTRSRQQYGNQAERIMQNVQRAMRVAMAREEERLEAALPFLATVGSTSPYIGLFGTVWGIMNSFRGLAMSNQASLAVVAPGISEALIATAIGLFAAIPAVIAYNRYSAQVEVLMNRFETFSDEFAAILNRSIQED